MGIETKIEWTNHTFSPWLGCTKVSAGCDHCYAERWGARFGVQWGNHPRRLTSASNWRQPVRWNAAAKRDGVRRRVFCASLADVFDNQVDPIWRAALWDLIDECGSLDWLLLTKRPQNIANMLPSETLQAIGHSGKWPWPQVWLGTTAENQEEANRRIPELCVIPAVKHFISAEPLLGRIDGVAAGLDLVIVGGESGPNARSMDIAWVRSIIAQCRAAGTACFVKQLGIRPYWSEDAMGAFSLRDKKGGDWSEWPAELRVREMPA